jgi:hypothetical protein
MPGMPGGMPPGGMPGGLRGGMPGMPGMMQDPEMFESMKQEAELEQRSRELAEKYRHVAEADRGDVQKQLEKVVRDQFELRQVRRQKELKHLEDQIKKLRETIEKREKARTEIIERRVKELLGQDDDTRF